VFPKSIYFLISSLLGVGYLPMPGTAASFIAAFLCSINSAGWLLSLIVFPIFIFSANRVIKYSHKKDPSFIVVDEVFGYVLGWNILKMFQDVSVYAHMMFFITFRFFDTLKPLWIKKVEKLPNVLGVFLDDIVAAVYSIITVKLLCIVF
jgi:phosphatidylglycerophosphatase A